MNLLDFFTDPVLRAPTLGSMLMCLSSAVIGCLVFLRKRSLLGEALSHAAYPGVVMGVLFAALFFPFSEELATIGILFGAFISSLVGLFVIDQLEKRLKIQSDSALCLVLSLFFGFGILVASRLQLTHTLWYKQIQVFLFGQAATMTDVHILIYGGLSFVVLTIFILLFRYLEILNFDPHYAKVVGMPTRLIDTIMYLLLALSIVVGMRSVGVVLMSAMLIAPAIAARGWTRSLGTFFTLAGLFGIFSAFLGNYFSVALPLYIGQPRLSLPTGPMIVLSSTAFCLFGLLFSPKQGLLTRYVRQMRFHFRCGVENELKELYKSPERFKAKRWTLVHMQAKGWIQEGKLTTLGKREAEKLIRLHRLWEVYLVHMGQGADRVHHSAEEMEHILTPEIESELSELLGSPEKDPHFQPIPKGGSR